MLSMFYRQENSGVCNNLRIGTKSKISEILSPHSSNICKNVFSFRLKLFAFGFLLICKISCLVASMVAYVMGVFKNAQKGASSTRECLWVLFQNPRRRSSADMVAFGRSNLFSLLGTMAIRLYGI
jgi:hypothetical protein